MSSHVVQKRKCVRYYSWKKLEDHVTQESSQGHNKKQFKLSKKAKMNFFFLKKRVTLQWRPDKHNLCQGIKVIITSDVMMTVCALI